MKHPIQPSPELVSQCMEMFKSGTRMEAMCEVAAQWGADQELDACCGWLEINYNTPLACHPLRTARRPKPPTVKEQALKALKVLPTPAGQVTLDITDLNTIRRALEALPNDN